jgi:uncharacterized protein (DUF58 family)
VTLPDPGQSGGAGGWQAGPAWAGAGAKVRRPFRWSRFLWSLVDPQKGQRILPTFPGLVLISLCLGLGAAAYNTSSNILFITLSILLACLILSGVLSWLNLRRVVWRLRLAPPLRAGEEARVTLELRNGKRFLPTYGLHFGLEARPWEDGGPARAESTVRASGVEVRALLARAEEGVQRGRLVLPGRLEPGGGARVEWVFRPERRGRLRVELASVGSLFPFGFLRKELATEMRVDAVVRPAPVSYRWHGPGARRRLRGDEQLARAGTGGDLLGLRRFAAGDSHRLIHWKASARSGELLVRQLAEEAGEGYCLRVLTAEPLWPRPEPFERMIRLAGSLAEDLFRAGRLASVALDDAPARPVWRRPELEAWLDELAVARRTPGPAVPVAAGRGEGEMLTLAPDGGDGVAAWVGTARVASA